MTPYFPSLEYVGTLTNKNLIALHLSVYADNVQSAI